MIKYSISEAVEVDPNVQVRLNYFNQFEIVKFTQMV